MGRKYAAALPATYYGQWPRVFAGKSGRFGRANAHNATRARRLIPRLCVPLHLKEEGRFAAVAIPPRRRYSPASHERPEQPCVTPERASQRSLLARPRGKMPNQCRRRDHGRRARSAAEHRDHVRLDGRSGRPAGSPHPPPWSRSRPVDAGKVGIPAVVVPSAAPAANQTALQTTHPSWKVERLGTIACLFGRLWLGRIGRAMGGHGLQLRRAVLELDGVTQDPALGVFAGKAQHHATCLACELAEARGLLQQGFLARFDGRLRPKSKD